MTPPALLMAALEAAANRFLVQDPHSLKQLAALGGSLSVRHEELNWECGVYPVPHGLQLAAPDAAPRATVSLTTGAILKLLREPGAGRAVPGMVVAGDAEYLQALADILQGVEADLSGVLEPWLGVQAGPAAAGLERAFGWLRSSWRQFEEDGARFLATESRDLVGAEELGEWMDAVDELSMAVDRMEARLRRLHESRS